MYSDCRNKLVCSADNLNGNGKVKDPVSLYNWPLPWIGYEAQLTFSMLQYDDWKLYTEDFLPCICDSS